MLETRTRAEIVYDIENAKMGIERLEDEIFELKSQLMTLEGQKTEMERDLSGFEEELEQ